jgi:glycosyltransferase involved in cell wall biosynthesis
MKQPLVSVIVPCYNQAAFLSEALESVISQTYTNWECIVVNDGSTDHTEAIVKSYIDIDFRFKYIHQDNGGVASARNTGVKYSIGEYILPLDGDDKLNEIFIEKAVQLFLENKNIQLVYPEVELFGNENRIWNLRQYNYEELLFQNMLVCTSMYRKSDFEKTSGYNPNMKNGYEDWDFWLSFINENDLVVKSDKSVLYYRIKTNSRNSIPGVEKKKLYQQIFDNHPNTYKKYTLEFNRDLIYYKHVEKDYYSQQDYVQNLERQLQSVQNSKAYRLGRLILKPFKWMKK